MAEKKWPMPGEVRQQNWGTTKGKLSDSKIDDTKAGVEKTQAHNDKVTSRQTPKKFA
jgi:hypothetical protein